MARTPSPIARSSAAKSGACGTPLKPASGLATLDPGGADRARQPVYVLTKFGIPIVRPRPQRELHPRRAVIAEHELGTGVNEPRQRPIRRAEIAEELVKLLFCLRLRNGGPVADRLNKLSAGLCGVRPGYVDVPDIDTGLSSAGHHRESTDRQRTAMQGVDLYGRHSVQDTCVDHRTGALKRFLGWLEHEPDPTAKPLSQP
jgi:hypothetical protein